ncbi:MAG: hypothetical protein HW421_3782 [Ignavibacteria bacterium]|nr:hypothetical protein [Ignavibacteria bacterium]
MISENQLKELVDKIVKEYHPEKILLFGSYSDGSANNDSDLDLLVIKESHESRSNRIADLRMRLLKYKFEFPIDVLVYTNKELQDENLGRFSFIYNVLKSGKVVYEQ